AGEAECRIRRRDERATRGRSEVLVLCRRRDRRSSDEDFRYSGEIDQLPVIRIELRITAQSLVVIPHLVIYHYSRQATDHEPVVRIYLVRNRHSVLCLVDDRKLSDVSTSTQISSLGQPSKARATEQAGHRESPLAP